MANKGCPDYPSAFCNDERRCWRCDAEVASATWLARQVDVPPVADYRSAWQELSGYVQEAVDDGGTITPSDLLAYMVELETTVKKPGKDWLRKMMGEN